MCLMGGRYPYNGAFLINRAENRGISYLYSFRDLNGEETLNLVAVMVHRRQPSQLSGLMTRTVHGSKLNGADNNFENGGEVSNTKSSLSSRTRH